MTTRMRQQAPTCIGKFINESCYLTNEFFTSAFKAYFNIRKGNYLNKYTMPKSGCDTSV